MRQTACSVTYSAAGAKPRRSISAAWKIRWRSAYRAQPNVDQPAIRAYLQSVRKRMPGSGYRHGREIRDAGPKSPLSCTNRASGALYIAYQLRQRNVNSPATMGVARWMISSALSLVVAQRLVRKLCPHCRRDGGRPPVLHSLLAPITWLTAAGGGCPVLPRWLLRPPAWYSNCWWIAHASGH